MKRRGYKRRGKSRRLVFKLPSPFKRKYRRRSRRRH